MAKSSDVDIDLWALQGLEVFKSKGLSDERPLDRKTEFDLNRNLEKNN